MSLAWVGYALVGLIVVTYVVGCVAWVVMMHRLGRNLRL